MAKKRAARRASDPSEDDGPKATAAEEPDQPADDQSPRVRKAAETVRRAEEKLEKARELYEEVRREATDRLKAVREKSLGDLVDGTLQTVRKYPGTGVIVAALLGFFLGRLFRR